MRAKITAAGKARLERLADAKRTAALRPDGGVPTPAHVFEYDVFVSHASEDSADFVDALVAELNRRKLKVWYDRERMSRGDDMIARINDGLRASRCGVIVASPRYFAKVYTKPEISALLHFAMRDESRKVLPVLYQMNQDDLLAVHPVLANHVNIDAAQYDPAEIARIIHAAVTPPDAAELNRPLFSALGSIIWGIGVLGTSFACLPLSRYESRVPYDALPGQPHLLGVRPLIDIEWYEPDSAGGYTCLAWSVTNSGNGEAHDIAVFLPGIASYRIDALPVGASKRERLRFDDRYAYHETIEGDDRAVIEFTDAHGNLYRTYATVDASANSDRGPARYKTTTFAGPIPVSGRIVRPDPEHDRFLLTAPIGVPSFTAGPRMLGP